MVLPVLCGSYVCVDTRGLAVPSGGEDVFAAQNETMDDTPNDPFPAAEDNEEDAPLR
jgi:hypothetical protein